MSNLVKETINDKNRIIDSLGNAETGLKSLLLQLEQQKSSLIASADNEDRLYQKYLSDLEEWENKKKQIIGDILINDSFEYYKAEKEYIENELENVYTDTLNNRNLLLKQIYHAKEELIEIYQDLYLPIQKEITGILGEIEDSIAFKAELFVNNKLLEQDILKYIDLRYSGKYSRAKGQNELEELIRNTDFKTFDSLVSFVEETTKVITEDFDNADKKVGNRLGFYNYLFSLDYIDVNFKLKMGERSLDELSPGERGLVLLIFYLALNKESKPIIIDQPEDNLDNQSVFSKLVPCICKAKQKRQVIIVTHNPNIAIACDTEQIIYCEMDKTNSKISYISGSIENPKIKKHIIDVLEGTQPAFELRRQKYLLEKTNKE